MTLLKGEDLFMEFGGIHAIEDLSFEFEAGAIHSIIGPNGAGKTTLFNLITGLYRPSAGRILFDGEEITGRAPHELAERGICRTFQNLQVFFNMTALENVMVGRHRHDGVAFVAAALRLPSVLRANRSSRRRARELLDFVGLAGQADMPSDALAYGALKRIEIARALATEPRLILLDEPAAGCNPRETQEINGLIRKIAQSGVTVVLVEHDMRLVMGVSDHVLVLDYGRKLAEGTAREVQNNAEVVAAYLGSAAIEA